MIENRRKGMRTMFSGNRDVNASFKITIQRDLKKLFSRHRYVEKVHNLHKGLTLSAHLTHNLERISQQL